MHIPRQRAGSTPATASVQGDHAVVLGASMAGLLAARVLADHFSQVTVVERDRLPTGVGPRRGVPQARHAHVLLPRGAAILDELFPGILEEMVAAGVPVGESLGQIHFEINGHLLFHDPDAEGSRRGDDEVALYEPSRPFLDAVVVNRLRELPNVDLLCGYDVAALTADSTLSRVTGARLAPRDPSQPQRGLAADLVVAATGRNGRAPGCLRDMGYATPPEEQLPVDLKYVSQRVRFPAGTVDHRRALLVGPRPERPTGAGAFAQEAGSWIVTLFGYGRHHPPLDRDAWLAFGDAVLPPDFAQALRAAEPLGDLHQHRFSANLRRHYEKLHRFPDGFLVTGDALCSFNPIYGQGMTVAALEALCLRQSLREGIDGLAPRFFSAAARPIGAAWMAAAGGDLTMPTDLVPGARPLTVRAVNSYLDRFQSAAEHDPVLAWRFLDVTGFDEPPGALFAPDSLRRMASDRRRRRAESSRAWAAAGRGQVWP